MKEEYKDLPYRPGVGLLVFNDKGEVFIGERLGSNGAWQMPQGGIDEEDGDDLLATIYRELYEETGIEQARVEVLQITEDWLYYDLPEYLIPKVFGGKYRGQKQKWVALKFTGHDEEINLSAHRHQEFGDWQWLPISEALETVVRFKRHTYETALEEFKGLVASF